MVRDFRINGPSLVKVKGGLHWDTNLFIDDASKSQELGLALGDIKIVPNFYHKNLKTDDFGSEVAPDVQSNLVNVTINMTLVHLDQAVLSLCMQEAMGVNGVTFGNLIPQMDGTCSPAGTPLGKGLPMFSSGNNLISLNVLSEDENNPWRFRSCYLAEQPFTYPLGTKNSEVVLTWTGIPYQPLFVPSPLSGAIGPPVLVVQQFASSGAGNFQELSSSGVVIWDHTLDN